MNQNLLESMQVEEDNKLLNKQIELLEVMRRGKPEDRSERARRYAVTITEFEKVIAYFKTFVVEEF